MLAEREAVAKALIKLRSQSFVRIDAQRDSSKYVQGKAGQVTLEPDGNIRSIKGIIGC